jgi:hypothetical protein
MRRWMMSVQPAHVQFDRFLFKYGRWFDLTKGDDLNALTQAEPLGRFSRQALIEIGEQMPPRNRKTAVVEEIDPFAPGQDNEPDGDEAQTETTPPWLEDNNETDVKNTDTSKKVGVVTVGSEGKIVSTFKGGRDYDAPWVVVHADSVTESLAVINDKDFAELLTRVQAAAQYFAGQAPASPTASAQNSSQNGSQARTQGKPAAATEGPWGVQTCPHGTMTFRSGMGDNGVWQGYFCPAPRNSSDKCKTKYVR